MIQKLNAVGKWKQGQKSVNDGEDAGRMRQNDYSEKFGYTCRNIDWSFCRNTIFFLPTFPDDSISLLRIALAVSCLLPSTSILNECHEPALFTAVISYDGSPRGACLKGLIRIYLEGWFSGQDSSVLAACFHGHHCRVSIAIFGLDASVICRYLIVPEGEAHVETLESLDDFDTFRVSPTACSFCLCYVVSSLVHGTMLVVGASAIASLDSGQDRNCRRRCWFSGYCLEIRQPDVPTWLGLVCHCTQKAIKSAVWMMFCKGHIETASTAILHLQNPLWNPFQVDGSLIFRISLRNAVKSCPLSGHKWNAARQI